MHPVFPETAEAGSGSGRDAGAGWRTHPLAPDERRRAGRRSCAAAQTDGPCRGELPTTRCGDHRGENTLVEPLPRPRTSSPRLPRRDPHALAGDRSSGGFQLPTTRRALTGSDASGGSSILSFTFPREHELPIASLSPDPRRPRVRTSRFLFGRAAGGRSPWPTGSVSHPSPVRVRRSRRGSGFDPSHEHPPSRVWSPSRRRPRQRACEAPHSRRPRAPSSPCRVLQRRLRSHQDLLRAGDPAKGSTVLEIRDAIHRFTRPRPGSSSSPRRISMGRGGSVTSSTSHDRARRGPGGVEAPGSSGARTPPLLAVT